MLLDAPNQTSSGLYDLKVEWATLTDQEVNSVDYTVRPDADHVLVIDRSGSMNDFNKMVGAKNAGRLYVDSWRDGEQLGVVSFNNNASVDLSLRMINSTSRADAKSAINALTPGGATSIGDGAIAALDELLARGDTSNVWAIVILSDGIENREEWDF